MQTTQSYIQQFEGLGLFNHLDEITIQASKITLENFVPRKPIAPLKILQSFPHTIFFRPDFNVPNQEQINYLLEMLPAEIHHQLNYITATLPENNDPVERLVKHLFAFNQMLEKAESSIRFYTLYYPDDGEHGPEQLWGVICLPYKTRYDSRLMALLNFGDRSYEWTARRTRDIISLLHDVKLLPSKISINDIIELGQASQFEYASAITILNTMTTEILGFDAEMIYDPVDNYNELMNFFILWSKAQFEPINYSVVYTSDESHVWNVTVSFLFDEKRYETVLYYEGDWVNMAFVKLINQALSDTNIDAQFYSIASWGQVALIMCLRKDQIDMLLAQQLVKLHEI